MAQIRLAANKKRLAKILRKAEKLEGELQSKQ
jgi:hypothetical protein